MKLILFNILAVRLGVTFWCLAQVPNPDITQENIGKTICNKSWSTKSIRPGVNYTDQLKLRQMKERGYADQNPKHYEEDHLIPLELGGHPNDPRNLWPQPYEPRPGAHEKDTLENWAKQQVCQGKISLTEAQSRIGSDWIKFYGEMKAANRARETGEVH